jgi:hypothetical protein
VLVPFALLLAAPCTLYAVDLVQQQREVGPDGPFLLGIATTALAVPLVGLVAGLRAPGWRLPLWVTGGMLFLLVGAGAAADPAASAAPSTGWTVAGLAAAAAFVAGGEWEAQRTAKVRRPMAQEANHAPTSLAG